VASRIADSRQATLRQIQSFLGHMNSKVTDRYVHELQVDHDILEAFTSDSSPHNKAENESETLG
jgi:hypothetical protein